MNNVQNHETTLLVVLYNKNRHKKKVKKVNNLQQ